MANEELSEDLDEMSWTEIQSVVAKVKRQLDDSSDEPTHQLLNARLIEARQALAEIESRQGEDSDDGPEAGVATHTPEVGSPDSAGHDIDELLAELLVDGVDVEASMLAPDIIEAATTTSEEKPPRRASNAATSHHIDGLRASTGRHEDLDRPAEGDASTRRFATVSRVVGAFVLALLAGTAGVLLIGSLDAPDDRALPDAPEPVGELEEYREVLAVLDAGPLIVGLEGSVLRISGTVGSSEQLEVVRETAAVMVDYEELDTSGVVVDGPLIVAGESAVTPQDDRLAPKLQRDLRRLLHTTPVMFEPGESELAELDRRILNAAVALILSAPVAEIVINGHPDQTGPGQGDADLATARAAAVRDYLVMRGIDPDILASRGSATPEPDGALGAIDLIVNAEMPNP